MLIDLHNHTWPRSHDSVLSPDDLIERARAAGLDGVCLTEHDTVWDPDALRALAEAHDFLILPGVEVSTDDGHILAFGLERYRFGMHRVDRLAPHILERNGCLIAAHPYRNQMPWDEGEDAWAAALERASRNPAYVHCIALEALNGRGDERENRFSRDLCRRMGLPGTAGTDSHAVHDVGKIATSFEADRIETWQDLVREIQAGRFCAVDMTTGREYAVPVGRAD